MPQGKYAPTDPGLAHRINSLDFLAVRIHDGGRSPAPHATLRSWVKPRLDVADVNLKMLNKEAYLNISRTTPGFFLAALLCTGSACGPTVLDPGSNTCTPECDSWEILRGRCLPRVLRERCRMRQQRVLHPEHLHATHTLPRHRPVRSRRLMHQRLLHSAQPSMRR